MRLCAWINTLWFVGVTETQKVLCPQLSSLLLVGPEAQPNSKASQGSSIHTEKNMWLHFEEEAAIEAENLYAYRRWTIEDRFVQSPGGSPVIEHLHCSVVPSSSKWNPFRLLRTNCSVCDWWKSNRSKFLLDGCFGSEEKKAFCNYFFDYLCLCQSISCRTPCPFCLQVRSLKQKRLRRRANKSRKEKIPARRSPGALIRHSKRTSAKNTTTSRWQYLTGFVWSSADLSWDPSRGPVVALATTCSGHQLPQGHSLSEDAIDAQWKSMSLRGDPASWFLHTDII